MQSRLAVKSLEHLPPFRGGLIENSGAGGTTNKLEMNTNTIWSAINRSFLMWMKKFFLKEDYISVTWVAIFYCDIWQKMYINAAVTFIFVLDVFPTYFCATVANVVRMTLRTGKWYSGWRLHLWTK